MLALLAKPKLSTDFHRLWAAFTVSQLGSSLSAGALPLIAILVLGASDLRVALLAALSAMVSAAIALPLGPFVEFRRKRPVMIGTDVLCFAALATVPVAMAFELLSYGQLCVVATVEVLTADQLAATPLAKLDHSPRTDRTDIAPGSRAHYRSQSVRRDDSASRTWRLHYRRSGPKPNWSDHLTS